MAKKRGVFKDVLIIVGGLIAAIFVWKSWTADSGKGRSDETIIGLAKTACRAAIEPQLNDPNSAEWQLASWPARIRSDGVVEVSPDLRARNALGGMVRGRWICEVEVDGNNRRVLRLEPA